MTNLASIVFILIAFSPIEDWHFTKDIVGVYYNSSNDFHHPTNSILRLKSNRSFEIKRSNILQKPIVVIKGDFKVFADTLVLIKRKVKLKKIAQQTKKRQVTNSEQMPNELDCPPDTFLIRSEGLYKCRHLDNQTNGEWN